MINAVIKGDLLNVKPPKAPVNLKNKFEKVINDLVIIYTKELNGEQKLFDELKKKPKWKNLTEGIDDIMYPKGKTRKFDYSTIPSANVTQQQKLITDLYSKVNVNQDPKTFNGKIKFN